MSNFLLDVKGISEATQNKLTLIMGDAGTRKTTSAGTYPKPLLLISVGKDGGAVVLKHYSDNEVKVLQLQSDPITQQKPQAVYHKVRDTIKELLANKNHGFKTVVIDPYSSIQDDLVSLYTGLKGKQLSQQEWGVVAQNMIDLRDDVTDLARTGVEVVLICHAKLDTTTDSITGATTVKIIPKMTRQNGKTLLENCNNVMYNCRKTVLNNKGEPEVKFLTYIGAHPYMDTKLRLSENVNLEKGLYIEDFTYDKLQEMVKSNKFESTVKVVEQENPFKEIKEEGDNE